MSKICQHKNYRNIDKKYKPLAAEHFQWEEKFEKYRECTDCKVWKGGREDSHCYDGNYYQGCNIIDNGIPQRNWYFEIHRKIWEEMGIPLDPKRVLELGCSIGRLLWTFHRMANSNCVGIESSDWAVEWQRETYGFTDRYKILHENCEETDLKALGNFNFIYACHVLEHLQNPNAFIEKCVERLEDGGHLYFTVPDKEHQLTLHMHDWAFDEECLKLWFEQAGLKNVKVIKTKPYNPPPPVNVDFKGYYLHVGGQK